jgi:hypothetical protein
MAEQALLFLCAVAASPGQIEELSSNAIASIAERHYQPQLARALYSIYGKVTQPDVIRSNELAGNQTASK